MKKCGRNARSPYKYDRAAIRHVLETEGRDAALKSWPQLVVDPIARVMGLVDIYRNKTAWNPEWNRLLGTKPDTVLAGELGIAQSTVKRQRYMLGIPICNLMLRRAAIRAALDRISDQELAEPVDTLVAKYELPKGDLYRERHRRAVGARDRRGTKKPQAAPSDLRRVAIVAIRKQFPDVPLAQIGAVVGCTTERVRQVIFHESATDQELAS